MRATLANSSMQLEKLIKHNILVFTFLGLIVLLSLVIFTYIYGGGFSNGFSKHSQNWGDFGSFFGGTVGVIISSLSIFLVLLTIKQQSKQIRQQSKQIQLIENENLVQEHLRHLNKYEDEIDKLLEREIVFFRGEVTVRLYEQVYEIAERPNAENHLVYINSLDLLLQLTARYCSAIKLYEENVNTYFVYRNHHTKAEKLITFLEQNSALLSSKNSMSMITLNFCKMHLDGSRGDMND